MTVSIPPGVFDILPIDAKETWRSSYLWQFMEQIIADITREYGFQEIRTPIFERTELFVRGVGESSDIVTKEMYTFEDKGGRSMTLRPEGTAPVIRSFVENRLHNETAVQKLYCIGPMFRYERAQAGRYRQFHQFSVEAIGNAAPEQDVEVIDMCYNLFTRLGLQNLKVSLNSIGDLASRALFRASLQDYLRQHFDQLSAESKARFEVNPLRILDSKDPSDQSIIAEAPSLLNFLNDECREHFEDVKRLLELLKIPYQINTKLVRGLDYYNKTVFEITSGELGAQNAIVGGGRYDGLIKTLGGPDLPSVGFAIGMERVIQTMLKQGVAVPDPYRPEIFLIPLGDQSKETCFSLLHDFRMQGIAAQMDFSGKKLNKIMQFANQIKAEYVAVIGDNELKSDQIELKNMASGLTSKEKLSSLPTSIRRLKKGKNESIDA